MQDDIINHTTLHPFVVQNKKNYVFCVMPCHKRKNFMKVLRLNGYNFVNNWYPIKKISIPGGQKVFKTSFFATIIQVDSFKDPMFLKLCLKPWLVGCYFCFNKDGGDTIKAMIEIQSGVFYMKDFVELVELY